ncbi:MAG: methyltransferase domain-containing protein [Chitinispirillaceae bacterium]|nr:methyltransferase domain-containing protein [Chitinispirillaceae bacterium]
MPVNKNGFDDAAKTWDDNSERVLRARIIADAIGEEIPYDPSFTAMEYGCGTGLLSFQLKDRFSNITLIDKSEGMLEVLKEKIQRDKVSTMEVLNTDLLGPGADISKSFSVIYSSMMLHHAGDVGRMLSAWHALLNRPGYLCVADLDSDRGLFHGKDFNGHNGFDREGLKKVARQAGFANIRFRTVFEIKKVSYQDKREHAFPLFLMVAEKPESI